MKKALLLLLTIVFAAGIAVAQSQQLKTFHHYQGDTKDTPGLTYTGYEDELGNITRHGLFRYTPGNRTATLNYKNGKLDGEAIFLDPQLGTNCKVKYKDGYWTEINYKQEKYKKYNFYGTDGKIYDCTIILKCSRTEQGLPIGDFELTYITSEELVSIKGKFDDSNKATGYWTRQGSSRLSTYSLFDNFGNKVYFEHGYCLGNNDKAIQYGRDFLFENNLTEKELLNKGYYLDKRALYVNYEVCNGGHKSEGSTMQNMLSDNLSSFKYHIYYNIIDVSGKTTTYLDLMEGKFMLGDLDDIDFSNAFVNCVLRGESINFMSNDLYQKLKNDPSQLKYDNNLKKHYVVKTDGKTRLYIPLESEEEFNLYTKQKEEEKRRNEEEVKRWADSLQKERMAKEAITEIQKRLDGMMKDRSGYYQYPNSKQFYPIVKYSIGESQVSCRYDLYDCEITVSVVLNVGENSRSGYFESYKTNVIVNQERTGNYRIDKDRSFVNKERVNNIWDSIASLKNDSKALEKQLLSNKKYSSIVASYKKEDVSYNIKETDPQKQYDYYTKIINIQKAYLKFIELVNQIDNVSNEINAAAKDESDIAKSYQNIYKSWNLFVNKNIYEEVKRLEESDYRNIQDSCLTFIELRKTITQNNAKVAGYAKTAPTIVKAYNTYMKGVDLTWNPESGRNQSVREIINTQNALINELSKPNISEIDKMVKKSKAKTWEDVKKVVFQ